MGRKTKLGGAKRDASVVIPKLTSEEQAEREKALASILGLRATLPPLEVPSAELVRRAREESGR